ncbi:unnamed protein product [Cuscuta campestris]|uniref:Retroviral polymerase SH3-like domain-containing protein n=1 Tax=Cuscuta campestris TaxID=132261 RepID=A0A484MX53_9ASTE|nr:unnamed protein product [Cuscuta campestris]
MHASTSNHFGNWYLDTGANTHVTSDYSQLQSPHQYTSTDTITVGNGQSLPITHSGSGFVHMPNGYHPTTKGYKCYEPVSQKVYVSRHVRSSILISEVTQAMHRDFKLKELGPLHYFLGIEVQRTHDSMLLHQSKYARDLLRRAGIAPINIMTEAPKPKDETPSKITDNGDEMKKPSPYDLKSVDTPEADLRNSITQVEVAADLWNDIKARFSVANGPGIHQLKKELANTKQNGQEIVKHYGKLKTIWDELYDMLKVPTCKCGGCKCGLTALLEKQRDEEKVHQFLMGLDNEGYGSLRSNILSTEPLPSINWVYSVITQQEGVLKMTTEEERNPMGFAVAMGKSSRDNNLKCKHCGQSGHEISGCFQIIGYPEWWADRPRMSGGRGGGGRGGAATGRRGGRGGTVAGRGAENRGQNRTGQPKDQFAGQANVQCENQFSGTMNRSWIIDSGASQHMT